MLDGKCKCKKMHSSKWFTYFMIHKHANEWNYIPCCHYLGTTHLCARLHVQYMCWQMAGLVQVMDRREFHCVFALSSIFLIYLQYSLKLLPLYLCFCNPFSIIRSFNRGSTLQRVFTLFPNTDGYITPEKLQLGWTLCLSKEIWLQPCLLNNQHNLKWTFTERQNRSM